MSWYANSTEKPTDRLPRSPKSPPMNSEGNPLGERSGSDSETRGVGFRSTTSSAKDVMKEREKYLTARYPKHTMSLIRRRLAIEDWIDEKLKMIYNVPEDSYTTYDATIDLDDLLDLDESERIEYLQEQLSNAPQSASVIREFIGDVLEKTRDL